MVSFLRNVATKVHGTIVEVVVEEEDSEDLEEEDSAGLGEEDLEGDSEEAGVDID